MSHVCKSNIFLSMRRFAGCTNWPVLSCNHFQRYSVPAFKSTASGNGPDDTLLCLLLLLLQSRRQVGIGYDNGPFTKDYSFSSSCSSNAYLELQQEQQLCEEQRWVPYRHTNGVAIYHHKESKRLQNVEDDLGSEYMASSIVRGLPDECLDVLMHLGSHTTILGPASRIQLLEDGAERQVRRLLGGQEVMEQWGAGNSHGCSWLVNPGDAAARL